jgi:hypothetical protein
MLPRVGARTFHQTYAPLRTPVLSGPGSVRA